MNTSFAKGILVFLTLGLTAVAEQDAPNPYGDGQQWGNLPAGRSWGSTSVIFPHRDASGQLTGMIWVPSAARAAIAGKAIWTRSCYSTPTAT